MENKLLPIYALRMLLLQRVNPKFFAENADMIKRTSLAAQDYYLSGAYTEYHEYMGRAFKSLPNYVNIHKKYNLPYNPAEYFVPANGLNTGLVMDLAWSLRTDIINGVVSPNGDIDDIRKMPLSEVLHVYHNTSASGTPINALYKITRFQAEQLLNTIHQNQKTK